MWHTKVSGMILFILILCFLNYMLFDLYQPLSAAVLESYLHELQSMPEGAQSAAVLNQSLRLSHITKALMELIFLFVGVILPLGSPLMLVYGLHHEVVNDGRHRIRMLFSACFNRSKYKGVFPALRILQ